MKLLSALFIIALVDTCSASSNHLRGMKEKKKKNKKQQATLNFNKPEVPYPTVPAAPNFEDSLASTSFSSCCRIPSGAVSCDPVTCAAIKGNRGAGDGTTYSIKITNTNTGESTTTTTSGAPQDATVVNDNTQGEDTPAPVLSTPQPVSVTPVPVTPVLATPAPVQAAPELAGTLTTGTVGNLPNWQGCSADNDCVSGCCADLSPNYDATTTLKCMPLNMVRSPYHCQTNRLVDEDDPAPASLNRLGGVDVDIGGSNTCTYSIPEFGSQMGGTPPCRYGCQCQSGLVCAGHSGLGTNGACMKNVIDGFTEFPEFPSNP